MTSELALDATAAWPLDPTAALTRSVRWLLGSAAVLVFLAGVQLFVFPLRTADWFAWTIDIPMTAVFLGASYWASVGLEVTAARARCWGDARIAVPTVFTFTTLTLVVTLVHLDRFHFDAGNEAGTRAVTWAWLTVYAIVPVLMVLAVVAQARAPGTATTPAPAAPAWEPAADLGAVVRAVLVVLAAVLLGVGSGLLLAPARFAGWWPWPLTPLTAGAVGAWLVALGVAAVHARLLDDVRAVRPLAVTGVAFVVLQALALARHGGALDWSSPAAVGLASALAVLGAVSATVLHRGRRTPPDHPT